MERFNSQLYEKYINLKKRKFSEIEESIKERISDQLQYQSAIEQLVEDLKTENDKLRMKIISMQEQYKGSQVLLLKEMQEKKMLSNEVNSLKKTLAKKDDILKSVSLKFPYEKSCIRLEDSNECLQMKNNLDPSGQNSIQSENAAVTLHEIDNENRLVPDCCRRTKSNYGNETDRSCNPCAFHTLVELLVGMKIYVECQTEGSCFSFIHQMSGYKFSLSLMRDNDGGDEKLFYRVSSLGTIENIALEWMKDDMLFSFAMCPVFFDRLSRVIGHKY